VVSFSAMLIVVSVTSAPGNWGRNQCPRDQLSSN
jgi:hypothetical protein